MDEKLKHGSASPGETHELAGVSARLVAGIIDIFLSIVLLLLVYYILGLIVSDSQSILQTVGLGVPIAYQWYFLTRRDGQTPGKFGLGIRVIKADGTRLSDTDAVIRAIGYNVSSFFCGLGYIWAIFDKNNQTWHDKLARTYVVRKDKQRHTVDV
jgi:uncharacterized RDD family membrane protein YckC